MVVLYNILLPLPLCKVLANPAQGEVEKPFPPQRNSAANRWPTARYIQSAKLGILQIRADYAVCVSEFVRKAPARVVLSTGADFPVHCWRLCCA
jgi:hypothetical protein